MSDVSDGCDETANASGNEPKAGNDVGSTSDTLRVARQQDPSNLEDWHLLGRRLMDDGDLDAAKQAFDELESRVRLALANREHDDAVYYLFWSHMSRGYLHRDRASLTEAHAQFSKALSLARSPFYTATALNGFGLVASARGDLDGAERIFKEALAGYEESGHQADMAIVLQNLGGIALKRGRTDDASGLFERAYSLFQSSGREGGAASNLNHLGVVARIRGETEKAITLHLQAIEAHRRLGTKQPLALAYNNLGTAYLENKQVDDAEAAYGKALEINEEIGNWEELSIVHGHLGELCELRLDPAKAIEHHGKSLQIATDRGLLGRRVESLYRLGAQIAHFGDSGEGERTLLEALELAQRHGMSVVVAAARWSLGRLRERQRSWQSALDEYALAERLFADRNDAKGMRWTSEARLRVGRLISIPVWRVDLPDVLADMKGYVREVAGTQESSQMLAYGMSSFLLRSILGEPWARTHLWREGRGDRFLDTGEGKSEQQFLYAARVVELGELLFNLSDVPGAPTRFDRLKTVDLESAISELRVARVLREAGLNFRFVDEIGSRGLDYDLEVFPPSGPLIACEIKCKSLTSEPGEKSLRRVIGKGRDQLPIEAGGVVFVQVPENWYLSTALWIEDAINGELAASSRLAAVVVFTESWQQHSDGRWVRSTTKRVFENWTSRHVWHVAVHLTGPLRQRGEERWTSLIGEAKRLREEESSAVTPRPLTSGAGR